MNYQKAIITPPLPFTSLSDIELGGRGDSYFINLIPYTPTALTLSAVKTLMPTPTPTINLAGDYGDCGGVVTEGEDVNLTVTLNKASTSDTTVVYTITNGAPSITNDMLKDTNVQSVDDDTDYLADFIIDSVDTDFSVMTGSVVVIAGELSATITISTLDDGILAHPYKGYKAATVTLIAQDNMDYTLNMVCCALPILIKDSSTYPTFTGEVAFYFKSHMLSSFEELHDTEDDLQVVDVGFTLDAEGNITEYTSALQVQVDDVPVDVLRLLPDETTVADLNAEAPVDISLNPPYYRAIVQIGRRN